MRVVKSARVLSSFTAFLALSLNACSDSTAPSTTDTQGALESLSLGIGALGGTGTTLTTAMRGTLSSFAPFVDQAQIVAGGKSYTMNALGVRESFPAGTCLETLFITAGDLAPPAGTCTEPALSTVLIFWQSSAKNAPPDRMLVVATDPGVSDFSFTSSLDGSNTGFGFALYMEGRNKMWASTGGHVNLSVAAGSQSCALPLPPFAKSATCTVSSFASQADITLEEFTELATGGAAMTLSIPQQTIHGVWQAITETKPFVVTGVPYQRSTPVTLSR